MTSPISTTDNIARNFSNLFSALRASIVQQLYAVWFGLDSYRDPSLNEWLDFALPLVQAGQETSSSMTATYIQMQLESEGNDIPVIPPDFNLVTGPAIRKGIPPKEVYARPFVDVWSGLAKGKDLQEAIEMGADRLRQIVETDIQLSHTHTAREIFRNRSDIVTFRRVPTGAFTCALCLVASTQRYHKLNLLPIHPGCDCRVAPVTETGPRGPAGQTVDAELLEQIHNVIADTFGISDRAARKIDYRKILLEREHGEYGPVLTFANHRFTGPEALR